MRISPFRARIARIALAGALAISLVGAASAEADLVAVAGSTTVTPSDQAKQFLADNGVVVETTGPATAAGGTFTFPIAAGFGDPQTYNGLLAHRGGLRFSKDARSAVVRRLVAVRAADAAVLLAQVPGLRGGCGHIKRALRHFAATHPGGTNAARRHVRRAVRRYCHNGRVIVLARLTNLGKSVDNGTAALTADLELSRQAARIINRIAGSHVVAAGASLGSAVSTVTPIP